MKLVDILARELKVWPGEAVCDYCCQSDETTEVFFGHPAGSVWLSERAEITAGVQVTRAQWQAAVDALKVSATTAWTGEGFPSIGIEFEYRYGDRDWKIGEALYIGAIYVILKSPHGGEQHYYVRDMEFRPIRTPEQITAEEREADIAEMVQLMNEAHRKHIPMAVALHDAGYRKTDVQ